MLACSLLARLDITKMIPPTIPIEALRALRASPTQKSKEKAPPQSKQRNI